MGRGDLVELGAELGHGLVVGLDGPHLHVLVAAHAIGQLGQPHGQRRGSRAEAADQVIDQTEVLLDQLALGDPDPGAFCFSDSN